LHAELAVDLEGIDLLAELAMVLELVARSLAAQAVMEVERRIWVSVVLVLRQESALVSPAVQRLRQVWRDRTANYVRRSGLLHKLRRRIQGHDPTSSEVHWRPWKA
jgi:hypothetical protein